MNQQKIGQFIAQCRKKEQYQEKVNENIINIAKESEKNKKIKNITILVFSFILIFLILILITNIVYQNIQITIDYDSRLIECEIDDNYIICSFYGSSLIALNHK